LSYAFEFHLLQIYRKVWSFVRLSFHSSILLVEYGLHDACRIKRALLWRVVEMRRDMVMGADVSEGVHEISL